MCEFVQAQSGLSRFVSSRLQTPERVQYQRLARELLAVRFRAVALGRGALPRLPELRLAIGLGGSDWVYAMERANQD